MGRLFSSPFRRFALVFGAAALFTGFSAGSSRLDADPHAQAGPSPRAVVTDTTVVVFVNWGASNMGNQGTPCSYLHPPGQEPCNDPAPPTSPDTIAYEWWSFADAYPPNIDWIDQKVYSLHDPVPVRRHPYPFSYDSIGSFWHALVDDYHEATGNIVFMSNGSVKGSTTEWQPGEVRYDSGLVVIDRAMTKAQAHFAAYHPNYDVVFGGVIWSLSTGLGDGTHGAYPWTAYRAELDNLLAYFGEDVVANYEGARFYLISTVVPKDFEYPFLDVNNTGDEFEAPEVTYALDLEADVCSAYAYCSMIQAADPIKRAQQDCRYDGVGDDQLCDGWYNGEGTVHWGQRGYNLIGHMAGPVIAADGASGSASPAAWELAVEVPDSIAWCTPPAVTCATDVPTLRLLAYDDQGAVVDSFAVAPSLDNPDWTADFDGDDAGADWHPSWDSLSTAFLTLEVVREGGGLGDTTLARYAFAPGEVASGTGQTDFFRPYAGAERAFAYVEVVADPDGSGYVRARSGPVEGRAGPFFEDALAAAGAAADGPYVMPYDHAAYALACAGASLAACPQAAPDFFLARLPLDEDRPDGTERRFTFAGVAPDVIVAHDWGSSGVLTWDVDGLALAFPQNRRLEVEGALDVTGATLTAADSLGWGGVVFYRSDPEAAYAASGLHGVVVEGVRVSSGGLPVPRGAVEVAGRTLVIDDLSQIRGGVGVAGLLASGADADVTVTGLSVISGNDGGGVWATGGAQVAVSDGSEIRDNPGGAGVRADGYGTLVELEGAQVLFNTGVGVRALSQGQVAFANDYTDPETHVEDNAGGLDAGSGGLLDAGQCDDEVTAPCAGRNAHFLLRNAFGGEFDARSASGSVLYAQGNQWHTADVSQLVLVRDSSSVLVVCPMVGDGGTCTDPAPRLGGGTGLGTARRTGGVRRAGEARRTGNARFRGGAAYRGGESGGEPGGDPPLRLEDVLALVDAAERAHLAGDEAAFEIAASAAVAALDTSATEEDRRAAFEVTSRLFAWAQPAGPLADLETLAAQAGEGRPWALRALGVARASAGGAEGYADAEAVADTLVASYSGSEHARFGYALAVRDAVAEGDEAGAVSALLALVAAFPEAEEVGPLAALVAGAFPGADLSGMEGRHGGGGAAPLAVAEATAPGTPEALLTVEGVRPNPSASGALIPFALTGEARVEAVLYDVLGRRLAVLASSAYPAGRHALTLDGALAGRLPLRHLRRLRHGAAGGRAGGEGNPAAHDHTLNPAHVLKGKTMETTRRRSRLARQALRAAALALAVVAGTGAAPRTLWAQDLPRGLPVPGDGFTWERVGDRPIDVMGLDFGPDATLWATGSDGPFRLDTTQGFPGVWVNVLHHTVFNGPILALGRGPAGDTLVIGTGYTHRSVDGGHTWEEVYHEGGGGLFEIPPGLPHAGRVLTGDTHAIAYSDDRAASFTPSVVPGQQGWYGGAEAFTALPPGSVHPGRILAAGSWGINVSDDGGATFYESGLWQVLYYYCYGVAALEEPVGAAVAGGEVNAQADARAWRSADAGETWLPDGGGVHLVEGPPNGAWGVKAVVAVGGSSALVVLHAGTVYRTDDAGATWAPVGRAPEISSNPSVFVQSAALGPDGRLYVGLHGAGGAVGWVWRTAERLTLPAVTVSVASPGRLVNVPPEGGAFPLRVTLTNGADEAQAVAAGTGVYLPDGSPYGPLLTRSVTVPAHGALTATITQHVPAAAPSGRYRYVAYTGAWPDGLRASDEFPFVKVAGAAPARGVSAAAAWATEVVSIEGGETQAAPASLGAAAEGLSVTVSPNPSRAAATVVLTLPEAGEVEAALYDVLGRRVATLASDDLPAGRHEFSLDAASLPAGVYVVRAAAGGTVTTHTVTLLH